MEENLIHYYKKQLGQLVAKTMVYSVSDRRWFLPMPGYGSWGSRYGWITEYVDAGKRKTYLSSSGMARGLRL